MLHLGPTKNMYLYFFHLLLIKHCNSKESKLTDAVSLLILTLQLNWTRWVYNTLWGQPGTCIILLVLILLNVVLIAINWFGQSLASSPEMTRIAKIAFCTFCAKTKRTTTKTTITKTKHSRQNTYKTVPTASGKYYNFNFFWPLFFQGCVNIFMMSSVGETLRYET